MLQLELQNYIKIQESPKKLRGATFLSLLVFLRGDGASAVNQNATGREKFDSRLKELSLEPWE